jgi:hypothetical protein
VEGRDLRQLGTKWLGVVISDGLAVELWMVAFEFTFCGSNGLLDHERAGLAGGPREASHAVSFILSLCDLNTGQQKIQQLLQLFKLNSPHFSFSTLARAGALEAPCIALVGSL